MGHKQRILVLCTGNSCRSQIAEGWLNHLYGDVVEAYSAGSDPAGHVHPLAVEVMAEVDVDISHHRSKPVSLFVEHPFDKVITVCESAAEQCPVFPGSGIRFHRGFTDPAAFSKGQNPAVFRQVRDEIKVWLQDIIEE